MFDIVRFLEIFVGGGAREIVSEVGGEGREKVRGGKLVYADRNQSQDRLLFSVGRQIPCWELTSDRGWCWGFGDGWVGFWCWDAVCLLRLLLLSCVVFIVWQVYKRRWRMVENQRGNKWRRNMVDFSRVDRWKKYRWNLKDSAGFCFVQCRLSACRFTQAFVAKLLEQCGHR